MKKIPMILAAILLLSLCLSACNKPETTEPPTKPHTHTYETVLVESTPGSCKLQSVCTGCQAQTGTVILTYDAEMLTLHKLTDDGAVLFSYEMEMSGDMSYTVTAKDNDTANLYFYQFVDENADGWFGSNFGTGTITHSGYIGAGTVYCGVRVEYEEDAPLEVSFSAVSAE